MQSRKNPVIGLIGEIGSGKSTVARLLGEAGCLVADADKLAHDVLGEPDVIVALRERWGGSVLDSSGAPDRRAIAGRVFQSETDRAWLESIIHPRVNARWQADFANADTQVSGFVLDAPLLLEASLDIPCDHVIFVHAPREERLKRVAQDRGWDERELSLREAAQLPHDQKRERATAQIENAGSLERLREAVGQLTSEIFPFSDSA